ncbi:MAG: RNA polymerase sigma-54 factor [Desulfonauticus sp. 38_4375]|nr:MAG: RNA polymerase sigma-54 factor [Desulfonauticus sp. 38_4375]
MALQLKQQLKLSQQLVMTPQLQQAIKLLQLSRIELVELVQQELLENPLLEEGEGEVSSLEEEVKKPEDSFKEIDVEEKNLASTAEWENYLGNFSSVSKDSKEFELPEEMVSWEARYAPKPSLEGHLLWQLQLSNFSPKEIEIGKEIIGNLDSKGYFTSSIENIAEKLSVNPEMVEEVLTRIQFFDPVGVGSRNLKECLKVQLKYFGYKDDVLFTLVDEHLENIENRKIDVVLKKLNIGKEDLLSYIEILKSLDPYPGSQYATEDIVYISPDVYVFKYDDEFVILLNDDGIPNLRLNPLFEEIEIKRGRKKKDFTEETEYLQEKMRSAIWLIKSLQQRQRTLYKVVESIVYFQRDFFEKGVGYLKPLTLKDVAEYIGMHESTVSRVTSNKYVSTPFGLFELKFFFNSGLSTDSGENVGAESIRAKIKEIIDKEDKKKPLSDEEIAKILYEEMGVNIARRTVAKYRAALNIPSSSRRKCIF